MYALFAQNTQIIKDFQSFNNLGSFNPNGGNPTGCMFTASLSYCYGGGFMYLYASSSGNVHTHGSTSTNCRVHNKLSNSFCTI